MPAIDSDICGSKYLDTIYFSEINIEAMIDSHRTNFKGQKFILALLK